MEIVIEMVTVSTSTLKTAHYCNVNDFKSL